MGEQIVGRCDKPRDIVHGRPVMRIVPDDRGADDAGEIAQLSARTDPHGPDASRLGVFAVVSIGPGFIVQSRGARDGGVGALPYLGQFANEIQGFFLGGIIESGPCDGECGAIDGGNIAAQGAPAGACIGRLLPLPGELWIGGEGDAAEAPAGRAVISLEGDETVVLVGQHAFGVPVLVGVMQADKENAGLKPTERIDHLGKPKHGQGAWCSEQVKLGVVHDGRVFALAYHLHAAGSPETVVQLKRGQAPEGLVGELGLWLSGLNHG